MRTLSIDTVTERNNTDENESPSPLGKRKSDTASPLRSGKRSPLSDVSLRAHTMDSAAKKTYTPQLKPCASATKIATPYSTSKFAPRVSKEEVEATDEGRASVNKLSAWLASESAKKAKKPPAIVPAPNPLRFRTKPKINKEDVEATDEKRVSVKMLSAWISDDPFEQKKMRHVRSGTHVINKSRAFEHEEKKIDVQVERGSVHEKQAWLSGAFKHEGNQDGRPPMNKDKAPIVRPYQNKPKPEKPDSPDMSLKSVTEKKEWLNNAFKKTDTTTLVQPDKSFDSSSGAPSLLTCASADDATVDFDFPSLGERSSYDGSRASLDGSTLSLQSKRSKSPVRLYKKSQLDLDKPDSCLKTVHDRQQWLSNAFKSQPAKAPTPVCQANQVKPQAVQQVKPQAAQQVKPQAAQQVKPQSVQQVKPQAVQQMKPQTLPVAAKSSPVVTEEIKPVDASQEEGGKEDQDVVSVADRAKWLKEAFRK